MARIRVAVIGGGLSGLCAARYLSAKPDAFQVVVYEQSDQVGGTWVYTDDIGTDKYGQPVHASMYRRLRTNLPKEIMMFPGLPIVEGGQTSYIKHHEVLKYLQRYTATYDLNKYIRLLSRVESVKPIVHSDKTTWEVSVKNVKEPDSAPQVNEFDAVMVCNGQYAEPSIPSIPGLETFTGKVIHSHDYRHPEDFQGQTVVLLGAGNSGLDITVDLSTHAAKMYLSHLQPPFPAVCPHNAHQVPGIKSVDKAAIVFTNDESVEADALILCTGYLFNFPFLAPECEVVIDRKRVMPLYKHVIHTKFTSLSFIGIVWRVLPSQLFSSQVRFVMAALDGTMTLPSTADMDADTRRDYEYRCNELQMPHHYAHKLGNMQWDYSKELLRLANVEVDVNTPGIEMLYNESSRRKKQNMITYKDRNYELSRELDSWSLIEPLN